MDIQDSIPEKVFENVSLHSKMEKLEGSSATPEELNNVEKNDATSTKAKSSSLKRFFTKKEKSDSSITEIKATDAEKSAEEKPYRFGSLGRKFNWRIGNKNDSLPKRVSGKMDLLESDDNLAQSSSNLKSSVSSYFNSIFSRKKQDSETSVEFSKEQDDKQEDEKQDQPDIPDKPDKPNDTI